MFVKGEAFSTMVRKKYEGRHFSIDKEAWPPLQTKAFTPLLLVQYKGELVELSKDFSGTSNSVTFECKHQKLDSHESDTIKITKKIVEILAPLEECEDPQFILFEGAPGIGKSVLLKEIAYLWAKRQILQKFKLVVLICLRNPIVRTMSDISDIFQLFCKRDRRAEKNASACCDYLSENNGKDLAFLLDGYDEYPEELRNDSLFADIIERKVWPECSLIISSRPHVSVSLREQATVKVNIMGFADDEREDYIKAAMKGYPQKIVELTQYLQSHLTISNLCYVPFNMVVLVYVYKIGIPLPMNSAELYRYFICLTVCRHLKRHGKGLPSDIVKLTSLPKPYYEVLQQLSKLSLDALSNNKLVFTLDEINAVCPRITAIPEAINGFGLLQAIEHFGPTETTMTFNFLHCCIQEYLAAHYIIHHLSEEEELRIIKEKFWKNTHFNMFSMYIALTNGQRASFKYFLAGRNKMTIRDEFLIDQLRYFYLYHCFYEAGDDDLCRTMLQLKTSSSQEIDLNSIILTPFDVQNIAVFLTSSFTREWDVLDLLKCFMQDHGLRMLHRGLCHCNGVTINKLWLDNNGLTKESFSLISEITVKYEVKELEISNNNIIEDQQLYSMLTHPSSKLQHLYMQTTKLSSSGAISLFKALAENKTKLKSLNIANNNISDDACSAITTALQKNSCLDSLVMYGNPLTGKSILNIVKGMKENKTVAWLQPPKCSENIKKNIISIQDDINKARESQGCQVELKIIIS